MCLFLRDKEEGRHRSTQNRTLPPSFSLSLPSVRRWLSIILIGGWVEGSDGQMRARSPSLPQRQQRQSCVLLPTSSCSAARLLQAPPSPFFFLPLPPTPLSSARSQWRAGAASRKASHHLAVRSIKAETRDKEICHSRNGGGRVRRFGTRDRVLLD